MQTRMMIAVVATMLLVSGAAQADIFGTGDNQFTMDFVTISSSTNPSSGYGIVANDYRMGTFEVTNDQWNKFKAAYGTVTGSPSSGYNPNPHWAGTDVPTNMVSWYEAAQFVNYLNTSTGNQAAYKFTGTIHTGDYALDVWGAGDADGTNLYRNKAAKYYLPTENEWVKAAYWNGTSLQTYSNASQGDLVYGNPDPAKWNYTPSVGSEPWNVGSGSQELNGTYDMMGNVWEWMESPYTANDYGTASYRGERGGSYTSTDYGLKSSGRVNDADPDSEIGGLGFRVASEVPEPATLALLVLGGLALIRRRNRK